MTNRRISHKLNIQDANRSITLWVMLCQLSIAVYCFFEKKLTIELNLLNISRIDEL